MKTEVETLREALRQTALCLRDVASASSDDRWGWDWESVLDEALTLSSPIKD